MSKPHAHNLLWRVTSNVASQIGGRLFLTLARFEVARLIIRGEGLKLFGEYSTVVGLSLVAEWVVDFGMTDTVVRSLTQKLQGRRELLAALSADKWIQAGIGCLFMLGALLVMHYPPDVFRAGVMTLLAILFCAGTMTYRAMFRAQMSLGRDVLAEVISVAVLIATVWHMAQHKMGLQALIGSYVLSRGVYLAASAVLGYRFGFVNPLRARPSLMWETARAALPLGITGLVVAFYDVLDTLLLSKVPDQFHSAGHFAASMRLVSPAIIFAQAIAFTTYPLLSSYWAHHRDGFQGLLQRCLDTVIISSAAIFCMFQAGAKPILGLLGENGHETTAVLRLLAGVIFIRSVMTVIAPLIIIADGVRHTLPLTLLGLAVKAVLLFFLVPRYGAMGAALGYLLSEMTGSLVPTILVTQWLVGFRFRWIVLLKVAAATALALGLGYATGILNTIPGCGIVTLIFVVLAVLFRAARVDEVLQVIEAVRHRIRPNMLPPTAPAVAYEFE